MKRRTRRKLARRLRLDTTAGRLIYVAALICALASLSFATLAGAKGNNAELAVYTPAATRVATARTSSETAGAR